MEVRNDNPKSKLNIEKLESALYVTEAKPWCLTEYPSCRAWLHVHTATLAGFRQLLWFLIVVFTYTLVCLVFWAFPLLLSSSDVMLVQQKRVDIGVLALEPLLTSRMLQGTAQEASLI